MVSFFKNMFAPQSTLADFWRKAKKGLASTYKSLSTAQAWRNRWAVLKAAGRTCITVAFWKEKWDDIKAGTRQSQRNFKPALKTLFSFKTRKDRRLWYYSFIIFGAGVAIALVVYFIAPFYGVNQSLKDKLYVAQVPASNIVIAAIDDATLDEYGDIGTWSRELHGQAIQNMKDARAQIVGYDILFGNSWTGDGVLKAQMDAAGNVMLGNFGVINDANKYKNVDGVLEFEDVITPLDSLASSSIAIGHANVLVDNDNNVRKLPLKIREKGSTTEYLAFSVAMLEAARVIQDISDIRLDGEGYMYINYIGQRSAFTSVPYMDIIEGTFDASLLENKIVIVGVTTSTDAAVEIDILDTPFGRMPGVLVHANAMDTVLRGNYLTVVGSWSNLLVILSSAFLCGILLPRISIKKGSLLTVVLIGAFIAIIAISSGKGYILDPMYLPLAVLILFTCVIIIKISMERADQRQVTGLFGKYVSPKVAQAIIGMADRDVLGLSGENRAVTVFFADLRGFTSLSSGLEPPQVVELLNRCFEVMIDRIQANDGMINKFVGDNVMAIWNAPQDQQDHEYLAVKTAIECQQGMDEVNAQFTKVGPLQWGIGINTGIATAGSIGGRGRLEYTVIGDTVNMASRFCGGAPGAKIWVGFDTYERVKDKIVATPLEPQSFKGKDKPIVVYDVESIV
ncbi:MAG: adenylate/guanylate cyclase domain-containing protein [Chloroflexi bacterium]|mgnify:CR=1 FL=1|jgi:adenylate cyclase|nr:adenylate/guanylate cyclase domain-containing protein [Chloroflexota bacterium]MBT7081572.1 adenylate/guanylate cyclase domain-containing protein [Chloroflexota bacterium]MBT7288974.1 adenylate/guanylate cyclase domain-containing protein [Chloroflexota bacterium]